MVQNIHLPAIEALVQELPIAGKTATSKKRTACATTGASSKARKQRPNIK